MKKRGLLREALFYAGGIAVYVMIATVCGLALNEWTDVDTYFAASALRCSGWPRLGDVDLTVPVSVSVGTRSGLRGLTRVKRNRKVPHFQEPKSAPAEVGAVQSEERSDED